jgi:hypothetical protein
MLKYLTVSEINLSVMKGSISITTIAVIIILGTNVNVISLIEVAAWNIVIIIPTINDAPRMGSNINIVVRNTSVNNSVTNSTFIS